MSDTNGRRAANTKQHSSNNNTKQQRPARQHTHAASAAAATPEQIALSFVQAVRPNWSEEQAHEFVKTHDYNIELIQEKIDEVLAGMYTIPITSSPQFIM
jgi:predicted aconitase